MDVFYLFIVCVTKIINPIFIINALILSIYYFFTFCVRMPCACISEKKLKIFLYMNLIVAMGVSVY